MNKGFLFDLNRCTGCGACVLACTLENQGKQEINWRQIYTFNETRHPGIPLFHLSMACNHCGSPPCVENCPAMALAKDSQTGAVTVDPERCMGCKYCTWACPYDAPRYNASRGVIEKCDFCIEQLKKGEAPACVCACPTNALRLGDFEAAGKPQKVMGFTQAGIEPAIRFKTLRRRQQAPEGTAPPSARWVETLFESSQNLPQPKISLKSEWTLLVFTSAAFILVALLTAVMTASLAVNPFLFLGAGAVGMGLSTIHLGRKRRAFRALYNIKGSWLSREILLFSAFLTSAGTYLLVLPRYPAIGWAAVFIGFLSLFSIDRIYQVAMQVTPLNFHSAHTLFNGLYLAGILTGNIFISVGAGLIKLSLYLYRKLHFRQQGKKTRPVTGLLRVSFGFIIPFILLIFKPGLVNGIYGFLIVSVLSGELIDRTEYYDELDIVTPGKQMVIDLEEVLSRNENKETIPGTVR